MRASVGRWVLAATVASATLMMTVVPNAAAAPTIPDIDSLIDDSGPLPASVSDLRQTPSVVFGTESGVVCTMWRGRITHDITCAGDIPGVAPGDGAVQLPGIYGKASAPARFVPAPPDALVAGEPAVTIPVGHKVVFWDFSPSESMVCGVPPFAELVCELKEPQNATGPVTTHGFVIAAPQSWVL